MSDEAHLAEEFSRVDGDGNGHVDEGEFARLVDALGLRLSREEVAVAFLAIDVNGNGRIEFGEFRSWWVKRRGR